MASQNGTRISPKSAAGFAEWLRRPMLRLAAVVTGAGFAILLLTALRASAPGGSVRDQLSYLASGGLVALFLLGVAGTLAIVDAIAHQARVAEEARDVLLLLYGDLVDEADEGASRAGKASTKTDLSTISGTVDDGTLVTVEGARRVHRRGCALVSGKPAAKPVDGPAAIKDGLLPCRVCNPELTTATTS